MTPLNEDQQKYVFDALVRSEAAGIAGFNLKISLEIGKLVRDYAIVNGHEDCVASLRQMANNVESGILSAWHEAYLIAKDMHEGMKQIPDVEFEAEVIKE